MPRLRELNEFRHLQGFSQGEDFPVHGFECRYFTQTPLFGIYPVSESFPAGHTESSLSFFRAGDNRKVAEHPWKAQLHRSHWSRGMLSFMMTTCWLSPGDVHIGQVLPASRRDSGHFALDITSQARRIPTAERVAGISRSLCTHHWHQHNL